MGAFIDGFYENSERYYPVKGVPRIAFADAADFMEKLRGVPHADNAIISVERLKDDENGCRFAILTSGHLVLVRQEMLAELMKTRTNLEVGMSVTPDAIKDVKPSKVVVYGGTVAERMKLMNGLFDQGIEFVSFPKPAPDTDVEGFDINSVLEQKVDALDWSIRTKNVLRMESIVTVRDLVGRTPAEFLRIPNAGRKSLAEVEEWLKVRNLHLGMVLPEQIAEGA